MSTPPDPNTPPRELTNKPSNLSQPSSTFIRTPGGSIPRKSAVRVRRSPSGTTRASQIFSNPPNESPSPDNEENANDGNEGESRSLRSQGSVGGFAPTRQESGFRSLDKTVEELDENAGEANRNPTIPDIGITPSISRGSVNQQTPTKSNSLPVNPDPSATTSGANLLTPPTEITRAPNRRRAATIAQRLREDYSPYASMDAQAALLSSAPSSMGRRRGASLVSGLPPPPRAPLNPSDLEKGLASVPVTGGRSRASSRATELAHEEEELERTGSVRVKFRSTSPTSAGGRRRGRSVSPGKGETEHNVIPDMLAPETQPVDSKTSGKKEPGSSLGRKFSYLTERPAYEEDDDHHLDHEVDLLEVVDHSVSTAAHMANIQNAIFAPPLPFWNRAPVVELDLPTPESTDSQLEDDEEDLLDKHVEKVLTKKEMAKQILKGLWAFMKTPLGILFTIYGLLIVVWGSGLVILFMIPFNSYDKKLWIEICCQILCGLFTITGVGLIPFRLWDTYNVLIIYHYAHRTYHRRTKRHLSELSDKNDIPLANKEQDTDAGTNSSQNDMIPMTSSHRGSELDKKLEKIQLVEKELQNKMDAKLGGRVVHRAETSVLTEEEDAKLRQAMVRFMKSQTWYHPHESATHYAFPIVWALWICLLSDGNSAWQVFLCGVMWGYNRHNRPAWTTAVGIVCSFLCGIVAGVLIWQGGERTKKKKQVKQAVEEILEEKREEKKRRGVHLPKPHFKHSKSQGDITDLQNETVEPHGHRGTA